ncbi:MAG TPA: phosphatidylglycerophosphatase A [Pyrinomonadaceae bacterium]|jgi:phosphatidylglycerophosphatase A|nr:phosphatidylglycerophosphatase A [Pyrinomonadaceae bacterium]
MEKNPSELNLPDKLSLVLTTCGVGWLPGAPGTYGSLLGLLIYWALDYGFRSFAWRGVAASSDTAIAGVHALLMCAWIAGCLLAIGVSNRAARLLEKKDPEEAVIDEVIGQLTVFLFVPFGSGWEVLFAGFILFRIFDIWKPYPIRRLQDLPGGLGICADDIAAGALAGAALSVVNFLILAV